MRTVTDYSRLRALAERCAANERAVMEPIERKLAERGFVLEANQDRAGSDPNTPMWGETAGADEPVTGKSDVAPRATAGCVPASVLVHS